MTDKKAGRRPQPRGAVEKTIDKPGLAVRMTAAKLLAAVIERKVSLDGMLDPLQGNPAYRALGEADRALTRAILIAALRHHRLIGSVFQSYLDKKLPEGATLATHILTVAATQILFLDVADHAAVDLAVEHARSDPRTARFANLVNALLRRLVREKETIVERFVDPGPVPPWLEARLEKAYGREAALAAGRACLVAPAIDLSVKSDPELWAERLGGIVLPTGSVRLPPESGSIPELPGFAEGAWWVQDAASAIPARLFGDLRGQRVADLCAAPGGKTAQLILAGARVTALDASPSRIRRLEENLARLGLKAEVKTESAEKHRPAEPYDAVLLDAPCSSTGTMRRHPDIGWTKGPDDIAKLAGVQKRLLAHAVTLVRPGGRIVFSNCSLDPEEGEAMIAGFLAEHPDVVRVKIDKSLFDGLQDMVTADGAIRTLPSMMPVDPPYVSGMDGFFACVLERVA